jgi:hypothetical protein
MEINLSMSEMGASLTEVIWGKRIVSLSLHDQIEHRLSVSLSNPTLMDQCQWSRCGVQSTMYSVYCYSKYGRVFLKQTKCLRMFLHEMSTAGHAVKMF